MPDWEGDFVHDTQDGIFAIDQGRENGPREKFKLAFEMTAKKSFLTAYKHVHLTRAFDSLKTRVQTIVTSRPSRQPAKVLSAVRLFGIAALAERASNLQKQIENKFCHVFYL